MAGNSWLAIAQESFTDPYRQFAARGGRPHIPTFHKLISGGFAGPEGAEDIFAMLKSLYNSYWEAKRIPVEKIDNIPMYILASYSIILHTYGSLQTFRLAKTERKWLRLHVYQEWYNLCRLDISDEL
ncbi:hypothetical protein QWA68_014318 [Fusarium oxysporum]|nr:hypothetical protein QWA68_014318 [Fusarium oxysporum]